MRFKTLLGSEGYKSTLVFRKRNSGHGNGLCGRPKKSLQACKTLGITKRGKLGDFEAVKSQASRASFIGGRGDDVN